MYPSYIIGTALNVAKASLTKPFQPTERIPEGIAPFKKPRDEESKMV